MDQTFKQDFLKGKVAIITGGATGICYGIAEAYVKYGCRVCIASRKQNILEASTKKLQELTTDKNNVMYFQCDIRDFKQVEKMVDAVLEKYDRIDILINGAAGNFLVPFEQMSINAFRTVLEIDLFGTFHCSKAVVAKYFSQNGGIIINISSTLQTCGVALQSHAGPAKAAIDALTRHLSNELGPKNIRVCGIAPGAIGETEGFKRLKIDDASGMNDNFENLIPLNRVGTNEDISTWALFLASPGSSYFTGQTVIVDGGAVNAFPNFTLLSKDVRTLLKSKL